MPAATTAAAGGANKRLCDFKFSLSSVDILHYKGRRPRRRRGGSLGRRLRLRRLRRLACLQPALSSSLRRGLRRRLRRRRVDRPRRRRRRQGRHPSGRHIPGTGGRAAAIAAATLRGIGTCDGGSLSAAATLGGMGTGICGRAAAGWPGTFIVATGGMPAAGGAAPPSVRCTVRGGAEGRGEAGGRPFVLRALRPPRPSRHAARRPPPPPRLHLLLLQS